MWNFEPSPKIPGTNRVISLEATEERMRSVLRLVPITRISDLTPLDPLRLPVFSAVTPLARDLTIHMGKGREPTSAKISAVMEAVERVSAEPPASGKSQRSSFNELEQDTEASVVDPLTLTLPSDTQYRPDKMFTWAHSYDLVAERPVLMASDLVTNPPVEGILHEIDTNGLAAGNSLLEATVHGLCEVIERDSLSQQEFVTQFGAERTQQPVRRPIDLETLNDDAGSWVERIRRDGHNLALYDITNDVGVATVQAVLTDPHFATSEGPRSLNFLGFGTHPCAATAVFRAISEAVQGRVGVIQATREDHNTLPYSARAYTKNLRASQLVPRAVTPFSDIANVSHDDLLDDLRFLVDRLTRVGCDRVVVTDLTRPELGVPVVRVRVPGLSCFVVNRRRVDWRCLRHLL